MPVQTTKTGYVAFPDGGKVSVKESGGTWFDIGAINSPINFTLNYTENEVVTANAGKLAKQISDMLIEGSLTLINLEPEAIEKMGAGMFERVATAGTTVADADITDQVIDGYTAGVPVPLNPVITASGHSFRFSTTPVLTSVSGDVTGALTEGTHYLLVKDSTSSSGWSILFQTVGTTEEITVDFGDNDPLASETIYAGTSTLVLTAYALKVEHTDSDAEVDRSFEIYSAEPTSGGFQFNFKGANEDGVEEMPLTFQGKLDTSLTDGRQLFAYFTKA